MRVGGWGALMWTFGLMKRSNSHSQGLVSTVARVGACDDRSGVFYEVSDRACLTESLRGPRVAFGSVSASRCSGVRA